jgi:hypothetical protein
MDSTGGYLFAEIQTLSPSHEESFSEDRCVSVSLVIASENGGNCAIVNYICCQRTPRSNEKASGEWLI